MSTLLGRVLLCACMLTAMQACAVNPPERSAKQTGKKMENTTPEQLFNAVLQSTGAEYDSARKALFANPAALAYLPQRFNDPDKVAAFVARQLHVWGNEKPTGYRDAERFIAVDEPALYANDRSAGGGGGRKALHRFLAEQRKISEDKYRQALSFLMLHELKHPDESPYIFDALLDIFCTTPAPEPEVWIRLASRYQIDHMLARLVEKSLPLIPHERLLQALSHERLHAQRAKLAFPQQFDSVRKTLLQQVK